MTRLAGLKCWLAASALAFMHTTSAQMDRDLSLGMHFHAPQTLRQVAPHIPIGSVRLWDTRTTWNRLQPERGTWDFRLLDEFVDGAERAGLKVLYVLGQTPKWASSRPEERAVYGEGAAAMPRDMADWESYVRTVMRRYAGRIEAYEVANEPKIRGEAGCRGVVFFCGSMSELVQLTRVTRRVAREIDPAVKVVSPSFDRVDEGVKLLGDFIDAGGAREVDVIAFHFYDVEPDAMAARARRIFAMLKQKGVNLPVWNTETGYLIRRSDSNVQPDGPAGWGSSVYAFEDALARFERVVRGLREAGVARVYWYAWDNRRMGFDEGAAEAIRRVRALAVPSGQSRN